MAINNGKSIARAIYIGFAGAIIMLVATYNLNRPCLTNHNTRPLEEFLHRSPPP